MKLLFAFFAVTFLCLAVFAQALLTNADVIDMVKSGLSPGIIAAKIRGSDCQFDTSTTGLLKLSDAKVPDSVVVAMIDREQKRQEQDQATQKENTAIKVQSREQGALADLKGKNKVYIQTNFLKARDLIAKALVKGKFEVVDRIELSEFVIEYTEHTEDVAASGTVVGNTATVRNVTQLVGNFMVVMPSPDSNSGRLRNIYSTSQIKYFVWTDPPSKNATEQFLKELNKVLGKQAN